MLIQASDNSILNQKQWSVTRAEIIQHKAQVESLKLNNRNKTLETQENEHRYIQDWTGASIIPDAPIEGTNQADEQREALVMAAFDQAIEISKISKRHISK